MDESIVITSWFLRRLISINFINYWIINWLIELILYLKKNLNFSYIYNKNI